MHQYSIDAVLQCLSEGRAEIEATFKRALDQFGTLQLDQIARGSWADVSGSDWIGQPGLLITFQIKQADVVLALPQSSGCIPDWAYQPDATGKSRLATLAQELSILIFPPEWPVLTSEANTVTSFEVALEKLMRPDQSQFVSIPFVTPEKKGGLIIGLRCETATTLTDTSPPNENASQDAKTNASPTERRAMAGDHRSPHANRVLPLLTHSLLRIRLPLEVTLARTRKPLLELLQLCPGAIIQFDKSCEEPLELSINGHVIARGEAVKVGDKFGLRILEMTPPPERYIVLGPRTAEKEIKQK